MGIIRTALLTSIYGVTGGVASVGAGMAYLATTTSIVELTKADPMFKTKTYTKYNPKDNPALQDVVIKRIPLSKIRPELRDNEEALTLEFCRGVWSRWGFWAQSKFHERYDKPPGTESYLWDTSDLARARYEVGLKFSNHFEVVSNEGNEIAVRCGGSPLRVGLRDSDGLVFFSARIDREAQQAEFRLKSALFSSGGTFAEGAPHPIPQKIVFAHKWYVRMLVASAVANVKA
ncbi:hypothetical protein F4821DRAFT_224596 [Hypoxylon rubiginosum]|uniref:Uncharacterized protein n=1 Tax=Hypoxylon rubiginosum TaxID=110542 RepID=A0ACC0DIL3_9PEZI|nr:hypothetical protein F4821DRAFT_224596 [Hypoxylon rubiginosum]